MRLRLSLLSLILASSPLWAKDSADELTFGSRPGYTFDVKEEKDKHDVEMVLLDQPSPGKPPINQVIFDEKLSKEFTSQYEYRFGVTGAEQSLNSVTRDEGYVSTGQNLTITEYRENQRKFGEYMGRRLAEYHIDNWAKSDPAIRPIYEVKDKISNLTVKTKSGYKFKWKYSFSGNFMDFNLENPYQIETKVTVQMNQSSFGPNKPEETIYTLGYPVTKKIKISTIYKEQDGVFQLVGTRQISPRLSTSITGSVDGRAAGPTVQQNLLLVGLSWRE
jgi:hypothetical protein